MSLASRSGSKVGVVTQARSTSTRLPGKILIEVGGKTLLDHHLDRLTTAGLDVYVATTSNDTDDSIVEIAAQHGIPTTRGSEDDVLSRFHQCAGSHALDVIVRVTSDCPFIDGRLIAAAVEEYLADGDPWLYLSNTIERSFPRGFDFEVFSAEALAEAHRRATKQPQREHVTPYLHQNISGRTALRNVAWTEDKSAYRVTVDTRDDLCLIQALIEQHGAATLSCAEIIAVLDRHPELVALNSQVKQKQVGE